MRALINSKQLCVAMSALLLAVVVTPVAIAGAAGGTKPAPVAKAVKQLKKQVAALQEQAGALQQQAGGLRDQIAGLQGQSNAPRPPIGPAGGDLTGTFPNPVIGPDAVGAAEIQKDAVTADEIKAGAVGTGKIVDNSITSEKILANAVRSDQIDLGAVGSQEIANHSVGALELADVITAVSPNGTAIGAGQSGAAVVTCPGQSMLIAGGFAWSDNEESSIIYSTPSETTPGKTWTVRGYVPSGSNVLYAWASCLEI